MSRLDSCLAGLAGYGDPLASYDAHGGLIDPSDVIGGIPDDDIAGWLSDVTSSVSKAAKSVGKAAKTVNKVVPLKGVARVAAFAVPGVAAGVSAAELASQAVTKGRQLVKQAAAGVPGAEATLRATIEAAKRGDPAAKRGVEVLKVARNAVVAEQTGPLPAGISEGTLVLPDGRRWRVRWRAG